MPDSSQMSDDNSAAERDTTPSGTSAAVVSESSSKQADGKEESTSRRDADDEADMELVEVEETEEEVGVVLAVTSFGADGNPGTGRLVRWADGTESTVRWGHEGQFDVSHVSVNNKGAVSKRFPIPATSLQMAVRAAYGSEYTSGIILRLDQEWVRLQMCDVVAGDSVMRLC